MRHFHNFAVLVLLICAIGLLACGDDKDNTGKCRDLCNRKEDCSEQNQTMFSFTECFRECIEDFERHESINCDYEAERLNKCMERLACNDLNEVSNRCAYEVQTLNACVDARL